MFYQLTVPGPMEDVEETRVLEWHCQEGSVVALGELLVELETDKAVVEIRSRQAGVLRRIVCQVGKWAKIGEPIAMISDAAEEPVPEEASKLPYWPFDTWVN